MAAAGLLDSPIVQLFRFLENLILKFDLGTSRRIQAGVPVIKVIGDKFAISMRLGCIALAISLILGVPMGILQARHKDHLFDHIGAAYTIFVNAVPRLVSYSLEPPIVSMKEVGRFCTIGTNAFLRTCLNIIWRVERPFIRASFI